MGSIVLKTRPDADLYVVWSSVTESPHFVGDEAQLAEWLERWAQCKQPCCLAREGERVRRAKVIGTSALYGTPADGSWDDAGFIYQQEGWLPREALHGFALALVDDEQDEYAYIQPFEDDLAEATP